MYPTLIKLGSFEITTFGLMMFAAFIVGGWVLTRQFRRYGLSDDAASSIVMAAAVGGIAGAKIYYAILFRDWHLLLDRAGLVWYGGLIGGVLCCSAYLLIKKIDFLTVADAAAPALAIGYALGRIGCFLVGDDYGRPTDSWVGIAFPKGSPPTTAESLRQFGVHIDPSIPPDQLLRVHPTQLYESASAFVMFAILMYAAKRPHARGRIFGLFLVLMGIERFLVEIVRAKDDRFFGPFTVAQLISVIIFVVGLLLILNRRDARIQDLR
ncbi:MAG: phosphatidylglycerol---prolipoprotein diacylglyceryl transferase [Thermoanaerobaculia bacterium]|jgi:phosphatidylglycerol:prolipoprotein diacylglycerol transferase|nr:phosphatidylglycerol---prolipoprotein diacylglyceryl transferase [Thermoanaerobaculia bacterium]